MPVFQAADGDYLEALTTKGWEFTRALAAESGLDLGTVVMGDPTEGGGAPVAMLLHMPPGYVLDRHAHDCHRVEVVVKGSVQIGDGRALTPGDVLTSGPGEFYGPHTAGPEGALTVEIFGDARGMPPTPADSNDAASIERLNHIRAAALRSAPVSS